MAAACGIVRKGQTESQTSQAAGIVVAAPGTALRMLIYTAVSRRSGIDKVPPAVVLRARAREEGGGPGAWHSAPKPSPRRARGDSVRQAIAPAARKKFTAVPAVRCTATFCPGSTHRFR